MIEEKQLGSIAKSLRIIALTKLADEFYTKEERAVFFQKLNEVEEKADKCRAIMADPETPKNKVLDRLEMVKYHEEIATRLKKDNSILGQLADLSKTFK